MNLSSAGCTGLGCGGLGRRAGLQLAWPGHKSGGVLLLRLSALLEGMWITCLWLDL